MANGILGTADLSATTLTTLYTVPADNFAVVSINLVNRSATNRTIRIALAAADTPTNAEYIEYDTTLVGNGAIERTGIVLDAGKKVVCYANSTDISVVVFGLETATS